ncbi:hypothetical protein LINPERPRIM_LOCUS29793 [Linum perenne]
MRSSNLYFLGLVPLVTSSLLFDISLFSSLPSLVEERQI